MNDYGEWEPAQRAIAPAPREYGNRRRRWLPAVGLALAFALTLGIGALLGSRIIGTTQAAGAPSGGVYNAQMPPGGPGAAGRFQTLAGTPGAGAPGMPGQCGVLTVSSVNGNTITAKAPNGSSVTIHTTASTQYTRSGQAATASAVTAGSQIHVDGTHNSDGSITATRIDVR